MWRCLQAIQRGTRFGQDVVQFGVVWGSVAQPGLSGGPLVKLGRLRSHDQVTAPKSGTNDVACFQAVRDCDTLREAGLVMPVLGQKKTPRDKKNGRRDKISKRKRNKISKRSSAQKKQMHSGQKKQMHSGKAVCQSLSWPEQVAPEHRGGLVCCWEGRRERGKKFFRGFFFNQSFFRGFSGGVKVLRGC